MKTANQHQNHLDRSNFRSRSIFFTLVLFPICIISAIFALVTFILFNIEEHSTANRELLTPVFATTQTGQSINVQSLSLSPSEAGSSFCRPTYDDNTLKISSVAVPQDSAIEEVFCNVRIPGNNIPFSQITSVEAELTINTSGGGSVNQGVALNTGQFGVFCGLQAIRDIQANRDEISIRFTRIYNGFSTITSIYDNNHLSFDITSPKFGVGYIFRLQIEGSRISCLVNSHEIGFTEMPLPLETPTTRFLQSLRIRSTGGETLIRHVNATQ